MTLDVQTYLRKGKTLEDLTNEYRVDCKINDRLGIVSLNYNQITSDMSLSIPRECRGLILELDTWDVVSRSFKRFFNYGEVYAASIDWKTARVLEKLDGSLCLFYNYKDEWHCATKKCTEAEGPCGESNFTFKDLIVKTINKMGWTWESFTKQLDPKVFYSFELTGPENRLVVLYSAYNLTLLAAWSKETLEELNLSEVDQPCGVPHIKHIDMPLGDFDALIEVVNARDPQLYEGIVVVDGSNNRVKIKSLLHVLSSRARSSLFTEKSKLQLILDNKVDDMTSVLPVGMLAEIKTIECNLNRVIEAVTDVYNEHKHLETQKEFAAVAKDFKFSGWLFEMRKGKTLTEVIEEQYTRRGINSVYNMYCIALNKKEEPDKAYAEE